MTTECYKKDGYLFKKYPKEEEINYERFVLYAKMGFSHNLQSVVDKTHLSLNYIRKISYRYKWKERIDGYEDYWVNNWIKSHFTPCWNTEDTGEAWYRRDGERNWEYFCFLFYLFYRSETQIAPPSKTMYDFLCSSKYREIMMRGMARNNNQPILFSTFSQIKTKYKWEKRFSEYIKWRANYGLE